LLVSIFSLHIEYAEQGKEYGILFMFSLFCEYIHLEYVRIHATYRVNQTEYVIHLLVAAPQEYVNFYSTRRIFSLPAAMHPSVAANGTLMFPGSMFLTETKKQSPNTGARANNTLHK